MKNERLTQFRLYVCSEQDIDEIVKEVCGE